MRRPVARSALAHRSGVPHAKPACDSLQSRPSYSQRTLAFTLVWNRGGLELNSSLEADPSCQVTHPGIKCKLLRNADSPSRGKSVTPEHHAFRLTGLAYRSRSEVNLPRSAVRSSVLTGHPILLRR